MSGWGRVGLAAGILALGLTTALWSVLTAVDDLLTTAELSDGEAVKWFALPAFLGLALAALAGRWLSRAGGAVDDLPAKSVLPALAALAGGAVGGLVAALSTVSPAIRIIAAVIAVTAAAFAILRGRMLRDEVIDVRAERARIARLRAQGYRVRARVVEAEFPDVWAEDLALFHVAADYDGPAGTHRVQERMLVPIADAPVVGGTVLLWIDPTGDDPGDVFMEPDPESIRHPDPSAFLPAPGPETGGMGGGGA